ncbi:MAG TPA: wax ester/triacylglycerol synthase family O-acyltransferase, partial [Mycobacterium sp.]|nr:wax ester/triacylglycerol synthase family O-acyltransferase [Mycobacterium sp.]
MLRPQRMSGLDNSFLSLETATQPLQVFCVIELDTTSIPGGYSFDRFRDAMATRLRVIPEFREKLSDPLLNLDFPVWVPDSDFDIDNHVHRIGLPAPGGRAELEQLCGYLAGLRIDHSRPLWQMWVIEGLDSGGVAVMLMLHHATADGVTFSDILSRLCSDEPDRATPALIPPALPVGTLRIAIDGLVRFASRPLHVAKLIPATFRALIETARRAAAGRTMAAPFTAPATVLNGRLTAERRISFARLDLADVKKVAKHFGVKVNDVAMALVSGQIRQYFIDRGELPKSSLVALVPVSAHGRADCTARNQVSGIYARLQTQIADPAERLRTIAAANVIAKEHSSAIGTTLLNDWGQVIGPVLLGIAKRVYARLTQFRPMYNIVVSNVPGPQARHFLGAEVAALYGFGPVMHGAGLNASLWSVNG